MKSDSTIHDNKRLPGFEIVGKDRDVCRNLNYRGLDDL